MDLLMLSCREAVRLSDQKTASGQLGRFKSFQLSLHLRMCSHCRNYVIQSKKLGQAIEKWLTAEHPGGTSESFPSEFKEALIQILENQ